MSAWSDGETLVLGAETARDAIPGYARLHGAASPPMPAMPNCNPPWATAFNDSASIRYDDNSRFGDKFTWRVAPA